MTNQCPIFLIFEGAVPSYRGAQFFLLLELKATTTPTEVMERCNSKPNATRYRYFSLFSILCVSKILVVWLGSFPHDFTPQGLMTSPLNFLWKCSLIGDAL